MKNRSTVCGIAKVLAEILRALDNTVLKTMALIQFPSPRATGTVGLPGLPRPQPDRRRARPRRRLPHRRWVSFPSSGDLDRSFQVCVQPSAAGSAGSREGGPGQTLERHGQLLAFAGSPELRRPPPAERPHGRHLSPCGANRQPPG